MRKEAFLDETGLRDLETNIDLEYAYREYTDKVEPFLPLISHLRHKEGMRVEEIGRALQLSENMRSILFGMPTVREYLDSDGDYMKAKTLIDLNRAKEENMGNAKFHEMTLKRYDDKYDNKNDVDVNLPNGVTFRVEDASADDENDE